ncbi:SDR family NAD(P)-dependent oxidoreductase [Eoetvoesiella caeni]
MKPKFSERVVVITGASRGIGMLLTRAFAQEGAHVVFAARRLDPLRQLETELQASGHQVLAVKADVGVQEDCKRLIDATVQRFGTVDILVNNAGVSGAQKPCWEVDAAELDETMKVNVFGPLACIRYAAPHMIKKQAGAIIDIGSFTGKRPAPNRTVYATSKMALLGLTRTAALELAAHKVRCNLISPGPVAGERVEEVVANAAKAQNLSADEVRKNFQSWMPLGEMVSEQEICDMIFFLASDSGKHMTGQDINMDSGIVMF